MLRKHTRTNFILLCSYFCAVVQDFTIPVFVEQENFLIVKPWLKHAVNHLRENKTAVNAVHSKMQDKKESTPVNTHDHVSK